MLYRDWLNLKTHLLWCYDHVVYAAVRERRYRSSFEVNSGAWLVRSGWAEVQYGDKIVRAEPGQWLILRPGQRTQTMALNTHLLSISFEAIWPDGAHWLEDGLPLVVCAKDHPALERKGKQLVGVMQMRKDVWDTRLEDVDALRFLKLERSLNEWLQVLLVVLDAYGIHPKERYGIDERVMAAVRLLNEHPLGAKLDQKALATQVGLSVEYLTRLFHHDMHTSPRKYFEKRRLNHAKEQLRQPGIRIKEVAYNLGFSYLPHFSKWFKSTSGQSPRQYAKAMLGMKAE